MCAPHELACLASPRSLPGLRAGACLLVLAAGGLGGCRGIPVGRRGGPERHIQVATLPAPWQRVKLRDNDVAYQVPSQGLALSYNGTCEEVEDAPLEVLTRHLLLGFTHREQLSQDRVPLDGREALRSHYRARLDGVPVELVLVVLKKDGCLYDFTYVSPPERFGERLGDFERLLASFHAEPSP